MIERRQCANNTDHNCHWVCVATEAIKEVAQLLVHHSVVLDGADERFFLLCIWQLTVQQQVAGFQVIGLLSQLIDWVATVQQYTGAAVDISDGRLSGCGGYEARIVGEQAFAGEYSDRRYC